MRRQCSVGGLQKMCRVDAGGRVVLFGTGAAAVLMHSQQKSSTTDRMLDKG